jgi:hypothetical protein
MKNLLLLLLLANVLYFLWGMYEEKGPQPGTEIVEEEDLGPSLDIASARKNQGLTSVGAVLGSGALSNLEAVVGRSCVTIGPLQRRNDADSAVLAYANEGMKTTTRATRAQVFVGHWVQIRDIADDATAKDMLAKLSDAGLSDAYLVRTDDEGLKISIGLFGDLERAEKIELEARSVDVPADITPRMEDRSVYFVDVALPPGHGAGAIVAKYGEDKVMLRNRATCPR